MNREAVFKVRSLEPNTVRCPTGGARAVKKVTDQRRKQFPVCCTLGTSTPLNAP